MKKIIYLTILVLLPLETLAHSKDNLSINNVLKEIMAEQNVSEEDKINCEEITEKHWEALGEAVMNLMHPNQKEHKLMDQMMGGEGSESLKTAHIQMGKAYLRCGQTQTAKENMIEEGMMPMMGGLMMDGFSNFMKGSGGSMMGYNSWVFSAGLILFWVLIIIGLIALIKWLIIQFSSKNKNISALDILKERYAKGEINKKEFEERKKDLID